MFNHGVVLDPVLSSFSDGSAHLDSSLAFNISLYDTDASQLLIGYRRYGGATGQFNPNQTVEKRQRKSMQRRTVDYYTGMMRTMEVRYYGFAS